MQSNQSACLYYNTDSRVSFYKKIFPQQNILEAPFMQIPPSKKAPPQQREVARCKRVGGIVYAILPIYSSCKMIVLQSLTRYRGSSLCTREPFKIYAIRLQLGSLFSFWLMLCWGKPFFEKLIIIFFVFNMAQNSFLFP